MTVQELRDALMDLEDDRLIVVCGPAPDNDTKRFATRIWSDVTVTESGKLVDIVTIQAQ